MCYRRQSPKPAQTGKILPSRPETTRQSKSQHLFEMTSALSPIAARYMAATICSVFGMLWITSTQSFHIHGTSISDTWTRLQNRAAWKVKVLSEKWAQSRKIFPMRHSNGPSRAPWHKCLNPKDPRKRMTVQTVEFRKDITGGPLRFETCPMAGIRPLGRSSVGLQQVRGTGGCGIEPGCPQPPNIW